MWSLDAPENRLMLSKIHGDEMRAEAAANREARSETLPDEIRIAISGRHFHVGSRVIVFGRILTEERCAEAARS